VRPFCGVVETETVTYADVVLPGSSWAEKSGTVTNTDRHVMRMRENAAPPGEARPDLAIPTGIGRRRPGAGPCS
jgi:formate dehydrogenase major subunit